MKCKENILYKPWFVGIVSTYKSEREFRIERALNLGKSNKASHSDSENNRKTELLQETVRFRLHPVIFRVNKWMNFYVVGSFAL